MSHKENIDYSKLPEYMQEGARLYIEEGVITGEFLTYIFKNDFAHAACQADDHNKFLLFTYAEFLIMQAPIACWGSKKKVMEWMKKGGLNGINKSLRADPNGVEGPEESV